MTRFKQFFKDGNESDDQQIDHKLWIMLDDDIIISIDEFNNTNEILSFTSIDNIRVDITITPETLWELERAIKVHRHELIERLEEMDDEAEEQSEEPITTRPTRIPVPQVVYDYGCDSWVKWFRRMYPELAKEKDDGHSWSAVVELDRLGDHVYANAKNDHFKKMARLENIATRPLHDH